MIVKCLCHFDDTNSSGGLDKQARLLAKTLLEKEEDVVVVASTRKWSRAGWQEVDGLRVRFFWTYTTPQVSGKKLPASLIWAFQVLIWVFLHRRTISVFHSHQIRIHAFVGAIAQKFWRIPHVLKSATGGAGADIRAIGTYKYFGRPGRNFIIRNTAVFIATTESIVLDLKQYSVGEQQIRVIPNGLVMPVLDAVPDARERWRKSVFLGRIDADKNVLPLAAAGLRANSDMGFYLDIYGRGNELPQLKTLLEQNGQNDTVRYAGFVSNTQDILPLYGWMLLPSNAEGLSNAMLESMACGVVPVATRVSGCVDHIKPGETGYFLDGVDLDSLVQALRFVASVDFDQWYAMSQTVRDYALRHFDIQQVADQYITLYRELGVQ